MTSKIQIKLIKLKLISTYVLLLAFLATSCSKEQNSNVQKPKSTESITRTCNLLKFGSSDELFTTLESLAEMTVDEKISWANGISNFKSMFAAFK